MLGESSVEVAVQDEQRSTADPKQVRERVFVDVAGSMAHCDAEQEFRGRDFRLPLDCVKIILNRLRVFLGEKCCQVCRGVGRRVDTSTPSAKQRRMRAIGPPHSTRKLLSIDLTPSVRQGVRQITNPSPQELPQEKKLEPPPIAEIEVLWVTAGLGCDGDTIAMTAATQPSIEEVVLGALPWIPKVNLHNPFLAAANGDDFLRPFHRAAAGEMENFILVVEGSIPNEHNKEEGYWASLGTDPRTGQPIPTCDWIDRLARTGLGGGGGGDLRHLRRHSRHGG